MKRLINTTTILSLVLYIVPPFAAQAQDFPSVTIDGQEVICLPNKKAVCPDGAFCLVVTNPKNCEKRAAAAIAEASGAADPAADQAAADQAAADQAAADQAAAEQAAAEQAAAEQAAAEQAAAEQATAEQAAAEQAAADKAAKKAARQAAAAEKAAAEEAAQNAAAEQAAAEAAAAEKAAADASAADAAAAAEKAAAEEAAQNAAAEQAAADAAAAEKAAADATAADATAAERAAAEAADAAAKAAAEGVAIPVDDQPQPVVSEDLPNPKADATAPGDLRSVVVQGKTFVCLPTKATACPEGAECVIAKSLARCEQRATARLAKEAGTDTTPAAPAEDAAAVAAAQDAADAAAAALAADPNAVIVDAPVPTDEAVKTLETVLDTPTDSTETAPDATVAAAADPALTPDGTLPADAPTASGATVTTEVMTEADTRASTEEFAAAPVTVAEGKKNRLSDFEKVGLVALGALVIGAVIKGNKQVVENTGDRVVVRQPDGTYQVYKDDNALLREPGSTVRTETFSDGSTRTIVTRADKSQIVTIRDAAGRVLQRVAYDRAGQPTVLIDDLQPERPIDVTTLPKPKPSRNVISVDDTDAALRAQLAADRAAQIGRTFSLRQIRTIPEVRYLAATIDVTNITFESGSSAIQPTEARKLNALGDLITQMIDENPGEVFLVEGHTDAVGSTASNLSLSDRRAESVAKALTEYFDVPPENLVVQGYGETELKVETLANERANRRVAVRIITPLLSQN